MRNSELFSSLVKGREAADEHMKFRTDLGDMWNEESVTDILIQHAAPHVQPIRFNQRQEGEIGADWLWWWLDPSGDCFGLMVQAKSLKREGSRWHIDFNYRSGFQLDRLHQTADHFDVPAGYMLYCGDTSYRAELPCGPRHTLPCAHCSRAGVSVIDAPSARKLVMAYPNSASVEAFQISSPLEDLADPDLTTDWRSFALGPILRGFISGPHTGAREIALRIFKHATRTMIFNLAGGVEARIDAQASYFLRGWREDVPSYLRDAMAGRTLPSEVTENIAGIMVFHL
jgi:hypothetical protein